MMAYSVRMSDGIYHFEEGIILRGAVLQATIVFKRDIITNQR